MEKLTKYHLMCVFTLVVAVVGFSILLSPQFEWLRTALGMPAYLPGARYNDAKNAAEIINPDPDAASFYLGRITFVYHSVFVILLYATLIGLSEIYLETTIKKIVMNFSLIGALFTTVGGYVYSYFDRNFVWHGLFVTGLAIFFMIGLLIFFYFKPKNLLDWNIWTGGILILAGSLIGGWLGSSFMFYRDDFLNALVNARFNPDLSEESIFFRALTAHEHAMIALVLAIAFLFAIKTVKLKEGRLTKILLYVSIASLTLMAIATYSVWIVGGIAHLLITPAALLMIFCTLILSLLIEEKGLLKIGLILGNVVMWVGVAIPGALVAMSLRKPLVFNPAFRDPVWDWAELAYNIGHWHILLMSWGIILLLIYFWWPENYLEQYKVVKYAMWGVLIGYTGAALFINLYMLANPPGAYSPNPYNNFWLHFLVEPFLSLMAIGIAVLYLFYLLNFLEQHIFKENSFIATLRNKLFLPIG